MDVYISDIDHQNTYPDMLIWFLVTILAKFKTYSCLILKRLSWQNRSKCNYSRGATDVSENNCACHGKLSKCGKHVRKIRSGNNLHSQPQTVINTIILIKRSH